MIGRLLVLAVTTVAAGGCLAEVQLSRMKNELAKDVRDEQRARGIETEARMLALVDEAFGGTSIEAVRARAEIAESYAQWKETDRALALANETVARLDPADADQPIVPALLSLASIQLYAYRWKEGEQTADRLIDFCRSAPPHAATLEDPFDECHFARYRFDDLYLVAGEYGKFAHEYLSLDEADPGDRQSGVLGLDVLGRGYARYGAYPEAIWYLQRCVDENRPRYETRNAPPSVRKVASTASGEVEVLTLDSAHSFRSQSPRCLEDLILLRRAVGDEAAADELDSWQRVLWSLGPDLEQELVASLRKSDRIWHDGYNTSHDANNLAFYYAGKGRTQDAIRFYREGIRLIDDQFAKDGVFAGVYPTGLLLDELLSLGEACEAVALASEAIAAYERAIAVSDRELHPRDARRLESRVGLARALLETGRHAEAETTWRRYLVLAEETRGLDHADYAAGLEGLAHALEARGNHDEAVRLRKRAATIRAAFQRRIESIGALPLPVSLRSPSPPAN